MQTVGVVTRRPRLWNPQRALVPKSSQSQKDSTSTHEVTRQGVILEKRPKLLGSPTEKNPSFLKGLTNTPTKKIIWGPNCTMTRSHVEI